MKRFYITDRKMLGGIDALLACIRRNLERGADMIQIREKDLDARDLAGLVRIVMALPNPHGTKVLVNERADIARASSADGVHLPSNCGPDAARALDVAMIGVSCHTIEDLARAEKEGLNYAVYGPVFAPLSKSSPVVPCGLDGLRIAARAVRIPIYALGGITEENAPDCIAAGAAGIAGITFFQSKA